MPLALFMGGTSALLGLMLILVGILIISKERRFPGAWALVPTVGAFLVIAAGPQAWANRKLLSRKLLTGIGLISYPLYLWHWPLLSFARIMEGETPSRSIRLAAVSLSFALAWLTYRVIESPLRWGGHLTGKAVALFCAMIVAGTVGYGVYVLRPTADHFAELTQTLEQFAWPDALSRNGACYSRHPDVAIDSYCVTTAADADEQLVLIGDSHANHTYPGIAAKLPTDLAITQLGGGGCLPFADIESANIGAEDPCVTAINKALEIASSASVKTVLLSSRGPLYLTGKGFGEIDAYKRYIAHQKHRDINEFPQVFELGMRETLTRLQQAGKKVVIVLDVPELGFDPKTCVDTRPLRLTPKAVKSPCAVPRKDFEQRNKAYRALVQAIAQDYANVSVFDAAAPFCDDTWCWAMKDGKMLYRDDDHLSVDGSAYLAQKLITALP